MTLEIGLIKYPQVRVLVACSSCGDLYGVAPRTFRDMRLRQRLPLCHFCRSPRVVAPTESQRAWWLERFTIAEIIEMAEAFYGPRELWQDGDTLLPMVTTG